MLKEHTALKTLHKETGPLSRPRICVTFKPLAGDTVSIPEVTVNHPKTVFMGNHHHGVASHYYGALTCVFNFP